MKKEFTPSPRRAQQGEPARGWKSGKNIIAILIAILTMVSLGVLGTKGILAAEDLSHITDVGGTVYGAWDFENGYELNHAGGATITRLGGNPNGIQGDGCNTDTNNYFNTYITNETIAQLAVTNSSYSLKTPYPGTCPEESSQRTMTTITTGGAKFEFYIRWYQKWTGDWMSGDTQHKFTKMYNPASPGSMGLHFSFGPYSSTWRNYMPNVDGRFDSYGIPQGDFAWIYETEAQVINPYPGSMRSWDDINNGLGDGGTDQKTTFEIDRWHCLEMHYKSNTASDLTDAEVHVWVDGELTFQVTNFKFWPNANMSTNMGITQIELQHINYNRSANDQPTFMDNIVIADRYIGPLDTITCSTYNNNQTECEANGCNYCDGTCQSESCPVTIRADVDQNSEINTTDAQLTLRNSLGLDMSSTNWQASATTGDVNCDSTSNSTDAMLNEIFFRIGYGGDWVV